MKHIKAGLLGLLVVALLIAGLIVNVQAQSLRVWAAIHGPRPYAAVSGPIEQGDPGFWRSPYLQVGKVGVSGPIEQGDPGFWHAPYIPLGEAGISGPIEQGDAGF